MTFPNIVRNIYFCTHRFISSKVGGMLKTLEERGISGDDGVAVAGEGLLPWIEVSISCTEGSVEAVVPPGSDEACNTSFALDPRVMTIIPKCCLHTPVESSVSTGLLDKGSAPLFRTPGINFHTKWKRDRNSCQRA